MLTHSRTRSISTESRGLSGKQRTGTSYLSREIYTTGKVDHIMVRHNHLPRPLYDVLLPQKEWPRPSSEQNTWTVPKKSWSKDHRGSRSRHRSWTSLPLKGSGLGESHVPVVMGHRSSKRNRGVSR